MNPEANTPGPGARLGGYTIVSHLGTGGMGEVYLAEDARLGRRVALKVLLPELARDQSVLKRFEREARAASALNHPSIVTIYELGQDGEVAFLVGEYIEGRTLREMLEAGAISASEAIGIASQIASALAVAHAAGIVHRDIKPENVMMRPDGLVKVLDFGLAKLLAPRDSDDKTAVHRTTEAGMVVGTIHYMSPEQARGQPLDGRSDIFSLGTMLYELVSGRVPFDGETWSHAMVAIIEREPEPLRDSQLWSVLAKALKKNREERYQTAEELLADLRALKIESPVRRGFRLTGRSAIAGLLAAALLAGGMALTNVVRRPPVSQERIPIAVADFDNRTGEQALDGLSGMLITSLEQSRRLTVMSRTRMSDILKGLGRTDVGRIDENLARDASRTANLRGLVTASVSRFGDVYIVDAKVLDPATDEFLFVGKEQGRGQESIPGLIDALSEKLRLGLDERRSDVREARADVRTATTPNLEAYQHYFTGERHLNEMQFQSALQEFQRAVALDPQFAMAWYRVAYSEEWLGRLVQTRTAVEHAAALSDGLPPKEKLIISSALAFAHGDYPKASTLRKQVLAIAPDDKESLYAAGDYAYHAGQRVEAIGYLRRVIEIDPRFERALEHLAFSFRDEARLAEFLAATTEYTKRLDTPGAWLLHSQALIANGRGAEAVEASRRTSLGRAEEELLLVRHPADYFLLPAYVRLVTGDVAGALQEAAAARSSSRPQDRFAALHVEAIAAVGEGRYRDSLPLFDAAIAAAPALPESSVREATSAQKAVILAILGRREESRAIADRLAAVSDTLEVWNTTSFAYWEMGDAESPAALAKRVCPGSAICNEITSAQRALFAGDAKSALNGLRIVYHYLPYHGYRLVVAALAAGSYDEAHQVILQARATPQLGFWGALYSALLAARSESVLARCAEARGSREEARAHYQRVLAIGPHADARVEPFAEARAQLAKQ